MGFDAFGLPAENAAIKRNIHPKEWTYANIERMRGQLRRMGAMIDWRREIVSADPEYYRWTQWFFLQFFQQRPRLPQGRRRSTGARAATRRWPASRSGATTATASAARRR